MERCDCKPWQCLALMGELPANQRCPEGRRNYDPTFDAEVRLIGEHPTGFMEYCCAEAKGG